MMVSAFFVIPAIPLLFMALFLFVSIISNLRIKFHFPFILGILFTVCYTYYLHKDNLEIFWISFDHEEVSAGTDARTLIDRNGFSFLLQFEVPQEFLLVTVPPVMILSQPFNEMIAELANACNLAQMENNLPGWMVKGKSPNHFVDYFFIETMTDIQIYILVSVWRLPQPQHGKFLLKLTGQKRVTCSFPLREHI